MITHNETALTPEQVNQLPLIGKCVNNWRMRTIDIYEHPADPNRLITVGTSFEGNEVYICDEERRFYTTALDYIKRGRIYVMG